ncbi:hypothetical protein HYPSUDRAFT_49542 [Hypholoma sublateritium FD-334 SS-4]|uniref:Uncharacterized protein n=1 Tax=Hypholoma sublateritium (strain FD-334 SS-4) TaxID=945553 RepID=A0A0D2NZM5_HYPSF|nr:hypothetical protein HYPSUDRAFT_49542 [Hypholoma sublateritium FD-334 SS-4]
MQAVRGAKLQFTLECPAGDLDFEQDFNLAATRLREVQGQVAISSMQRYFLQEGTANSMRLNFPS